MHSKISPPPSPKSIKLVCFDVDGVLTDGRLWYGPEGEQVKSFSVKDGVGIKNLMKAGIKVAVVSAKSSQALTQRITDLGVPLFFPGCSNKWQKVQEILKELGIDAPEACFVGDDLVDLETMTKVGLAICPKDAAIAVQQASHIITQTSGGQGVAREVAEWLLGQQGHDGFHVIIPARFASTRLPGKPLKDIAGKPMIQWVYEACQKAGPQSVAIATDHGDVIKATEAFGGQAYMTKDSHESGTDRIAEVVHQLQLGPHDIMINVQGDEPLIPPELIQKVAKALQDHPGAGMASAYTPLKADEDMLNPHIVKTVVDLQGKALYFSRAPIPFDRDHPYELGNQRDRLSSPLGRHIGIYGYRVSCLQFLQEQAPTAIEQLEKLEQLRALWHGITIQMVRTDQPPALGVDTPEDLERVKSSLSA